MTETGTQQGLRWVRESLALFKTQPHVWMLWALAYIMIFRVLPSLDKILAVATVVIWPACMAFFVMLYRQMDLQSQLVPRTVWLQLQTNIKTLLLLGLSGLIYTLLATMLLGSELAELVAHAPSKAGMTESQMTKFLEGFLPFMIKLILLLLPLFIATWFSPMLIALNGYNLPKAIKSSIAGILQYFVPMLISWVVMTVGMLLVMLGLGLVIGILGALIPMVAELLMPLLVFAALLVISALMFALQYISYKDVFRAAPVLHA